MIRSTRNRVRWTPLESLEQRTLLASVVWNGGGDNASWADPLNWIKAVPGMGYVNALPGPGDTATIGTAQGTGTITINGSFSLDAVSSARPLNLAGGDFTLAASSAVNAHFTHSGGTLAGAGDLTLLQTATWSAGTMAGAGRTIIGGSGVMTITGAATRNLNRQLVNSGTLNWTQGTLMLTDGGIVNNNGRTWNINGGATILPNSGTNSIVNTGIILKSSPYTTIAVPFDNTGTVRVDAGTLVFSAGGTWSGVRIIATGATLRFSNGGTHTGGYFTGAGDLEFAGGLHSFDAPVTVAVNVTMSNGFITGNADLTVTKRFTWQGGIQGGLGRTIISSTGEAVIESIVNKTLKRRFVNAGQASWTDGDVRMVNGSFTNNAGRTFAITADDSLVDGGGVNWFHNAGTLIKSGGDVVEFEGPDSPGVRLNNTGTVNVTGGTLLLSGGVQQLAGDALKAGTWIVAAGATLHFGNSPIGVLWAAASVTLGGAGADLVGLGALRTLHGSLTLAAGVQFVSVPSTGVFTNNGTLTIGRGGSLDISGSYAQTGSGSLAIDIGGLGAANFGRITALGHAALAGELTIAYVNAFVPAAATVYKFVESLTRAGAFGPTSLPSTPAAVIDYLGTGAQLRAV